MSRNLAIVVSWLREAGHDIPDSVWCRRTRAGRHQQAAGAWSWELWCAMEDHVPSIGSHSPLSDCASSIRRGTMEIQWEDHAGGWVLYPDDAEFVRH